MIILEDKNNKIKTIIKGIQAYRLINHHIIINHFSNNIPKVNNKLDQIALIIQTKRKSLSHINQIIFTERSRIKLNGCVVNLRKNTIFWTRKSKIMQFRRKKLLALRIIF